MPNRTTGRENLSTGRSGVERLGGAVVAKTEPTELLIPRADTAGRVAFPLIRFRQAAVFSALL